MSNLIDILRSEQKKNTKIKINYMTLHGYNIYLGIFWTTWFLYYQNIVCKRRQFDMSVIFFKATYTLDILALYSYFYADYTYIKNFSYNAYFKHSFTLFSFYKQQP